jgi:small-conductance mechanosensitive channel
MSTKFQSRESITQKITAILIGAGLTAYAVIFAVKGVGSFVA